MVGTLEEGLMTLANRRPVTAGLTPFEKDKIGGSVRLEIPFGNPVAMRRIGELLCGLGEAFKSYAVRGDITEFPTLYALKAQALQTRHKILETTDLRMVKGKLIERCDD